MGETLSIVIISDSTGETADAYLKSVTTQFPDLPIRVVRHPEVRKMEQVDDIFSNIRSYSIIVPTMADK